ncbi:MAG: N-carbamoylputrescine amidase, partial [Chloroflexota bacterium]|nr:N-carbamoylputrescine amidase [Chloroflexota bacterium]
AMTLAGADVLFYPTAIGSEPEEPELDSRDSWQRVMVGHAVANAVGVVASNRVGTEGTGKDSITFYGSSFVCDARGDKLAELGRTEPGIALATLDLAHIRRVRASMGFFRDRRPSLYRPLAD